MIAIAAQAKNKPIHDSDPNFIERGGYSYATVHCRKNVTKTVI
jgi:hypothetical protein